MKKTDRELLICYALTTLAGIGLHHLFALWPSIVTEFFAPVNESLWEHIKVLFWPYLAAGLYLKERGKWRTAPWLASLLSSCALMLIVGWLIHLKLGANAFPAHIALYFVLVGLEFFLPAVLPISSIWDGWLSCTVIILAGMIICWTIQPPNAALFHDLSLADTFFRLTC